LDKETVEQAEALAPEPENDQIVDLDVEQAETLAPEGTEQVEPKDTEAKADDPAKEVESAEDSDEDSEQVRHKQSGTARLKARIAAQQAELEALKRITPKQDDAIALKSLVEQEIGPAPQEKDFTDYLQFQNATIAYETEKRIVARELKQKAAQAQEFQHTANEEIVETFKERADVARKSIKDFDEVTKAATMSPQDPEVIRLILTSEKGPELAYYLSKNPNVVKRLNEMPPISAAREIGKLEAQVSLATPKTVTKAPEPIEPLKGATARSTKDPEKMSYEEYKAWRKSGGGR
jgi:hypothetical protein